MAVFTGAAAAICVGYLRWRLYWIDREIDDLFGPVPESGCYFVPDGKKPMPVPWPPSCPRRYVDFRWLQKHGLV